MNFDGWPGRRMLGGHVQLGEGAGHRPDATGAHHERDPEGLTEGLRLRPNGLERL